MKYIKLFEQFINEKEFFNEAKHTSVFQKIGKLKYNDQMKGNKSLSATLSDDLGFDPKKEFTQGVSFSDTDLYDVASGRNILTNALSGKYTYDEILKIAEDWFKENK